MKYMYVYSELETDTKKQAGYSSCTFVQRTETKMETSGELKAILSSPDRLLLLLLL